MSYPHINKGAMQGVPLPPGPTAKDHPHYLRLKWALGRRQLNISKFQGENIPLQASHLPHALI